MMSLDKFTPFTTAGIFNPLARIAAWAVLPPLSVRKPRIKLRLKWIVSLGDSDSATTIDGCDK